MHTNLIKLQGFCTVLDTYGYLNNVKIVTLAPELLYANEVIKELISRNIVVSVGTFYIILHLNTIINISNLRTFHG